MKVLNIMLGRGLGGIEQAFLDYNEALRLQQVKVINVASIFAAVPISGKVLRLLNLNKWDIFSILYLRFIILLSKPDVIIAHGNRAINFAKFAKGKHDILVGIAHNYALKHLKKCDCIIALTEHMRRYLTDNGVTESRITVIPNMIKVNNGFAARYYQKPIIIGTMARFIKKKGLDIFLESLALLKNRQYKFKAIIGGDGEEKPGLLALTKRLDLEDEVYFPGWVEDKFRFFSKIDIFCLPSTHEPFGIILLESMAAGVPILATNTEGPSEIIRDQIDGRLCNATSESIANGLSYLIDNEEKALEYSSNSYLRVKQNYDIKSVALKLFNFLDSIT